MTVRKPSAARRPARRVTIDGAAIRSLDDAYAALARKLPLPAHFGRNLDALWDALTGDLAGPVELVWRNAEASRTTLGADFGRLIRILRAAATERKDFKLSLR